MFLKRFASYSSIFSSIASQMFINVARIFDEVRQLFPACSQWLVRVATFLKMAASSIRAISELQPAVCKGGHFFKKVRHYSLSFT
jgi:hypothetical protein